MQPFEHPIRSRRAAGGPPLDVINDIATAVTNGFGVDALIANLVVGAAEAFGADECHVFLIDGDDIVATSSCANRAVEFHTVEELESGLTGWAIRHRTIATSPDITTEPRNVGRALQRAQSVGTNAAVVAPLIIGGVALGSMTLLGHPSRFDPDSIDLDHVTLVTNQVTAAIVNARLLTQARDAEIRLRDQTEELEALAESREHTMSTVAHELRNAVSCTLVAARLLQDITPEDREAAIRDLVDLVVASAEDASAIVTDLLGYGPGKKMVVERHRLDLVEIAGSVTRAVGMPLRAGSTTACTFGDPIRLRQILRNLTDNAQRYGGPVQWVEVVTGPDTMDVSVCDDGPGVAPEILDRLFEPYASSGRVIDQRPSLGLGLAVSRDLARAMGGDLVYSKVDGICRFTISLPAWSEQPVAAAAS
jgi:signal transduction histidine kinase